LRHALCMVDVPMCRFGVDLAGLLVGGDTVRHLRCIRQHQLVVEAGEVHGATGISLPPGASPELVVQSAAGIAGGTDHVEPTSSATRSWSSPLAPPSRMSVPRPAIWVDTVILPYVPASAMIAASSASLRALSTTHGSSAF